MRPALSIFSSKRFRRAVSILVLLALLAGGLAFFSRALRVNDGYYKNRPFLEDDREYDVLIFGTSHIINGVLPMQLWKEYGITSYNLGIHGGSMAASYWTMRNAFDHHKPKIAVMDTFLAHAQYTEMETALAHAVLDPFPMTGTKAQAILDIFPDSKDRMEMFFPLDVFHNRWKDLDTQMLRRGAGLETPDTTQKGGEIRASVCRNTDPILVPADDYPQDCNTIALQYLEKFIRFCQEEDVIPVVAYIPYQDGYSEEYQRYSNAALRLARELGAAAIDLQHMDLIDQDTDWYDNVGHLNPLGAKKVTRALGDYLMENYDLEDHSDDAGWAEDYEAYDAYLAETLTASEDLWEILSILGIEDFRARVEISEDFRMNDQAQKLLDAMGDRLETLRVPAGGGWTLIVYGKDGAEITRRQWWI